MTGGELREQRLKRGWSQVELAKRSGIHHRAVQYSEGQSELDPLASCTGSIICNLKCMFPLPHLLLASLAAGLTAALASAGEVQDNRCGPLRLDVRQTENQPSQYAAFCVKEPEACALSGEPVIEFETAKPLLERINRAVNRDIRFAPDEPGEIGEECWQFPTKGQGDCEDFALEKRRRLVLEGLPSASLTMAIVHHKVQFFPHAILLAETTQGTWVLDNLSDEITCWNAVPYRYERREQPDGTWVRYSAGR
jgi:predicted transglutaminase-like cysteine proteinase